MNVCIHRRPPGVGGRFMIYHMFWFACNVLNMLLLSLGAYIFQKEGTMLGLDMHSSFEWGKVLCAVTRAMTEWEGPIPSSYSPWTVLVAKSESPVDKRCRKSHYWKAAKTLRVGGLRHRVRFLHRTQWALPTPSSEWLPDSKCLAGNKG